MRFYFDSAFPSPLFGLRAEFGPRKELCSPSSALITGFEHAAGRVGMEHPAEGEELATGDLLAFLLAIGGSLHHVGVQVTVHIVACEVDVL